MSSDAGEPRAPGWSLEHRGSFAHGRCHRCGYASPARRAVFSVEADLTDHLSRCPPAASAARATERH